MRFGTLLKSTYFHNANLNTMKKNKLNTSLLPLILLIILIMVSLLDASASGMSGMIEAKVNSGLSLLVIGGLIYGAWTMYRGSRKQ